MPMMPMMATGDDNDDALSAVGLNGVNASKPRKSHKLDIQSMCFSTIFNTATVFSPLSIPSFLFKPSHCASFQ